MAEPGRGTVAATPSFGAFFGPLFMLAAGTGAMLLFWLEPLFAKMILPIFGGAPTVWIAALMFYQAVLLGGYIYAHALGALKSVRHQVGVHVVVALIALLFLPPTVGVVDAGAVVDNPLISILLILGRQIGVPMVVLAATAPLVQQWYARSPSPDAHDPYYLYAASNIGSLGALLAFPFVLEPLLSGSGQAAIWSGGFIIGTALIAAAGWWASRVDCGVDPAADPELSDLGLKGLSGRQIAMWALLAAVPSSLLSGTTMTITTDIAALPLLWVVPLSLYLLTYIIAFGRRTVVPQKVVQVGLPIIIVLLIAWRLGLDLIDPVVLALFSLMALFLTALGCHRELVRRRPDARHLTVFYIALASGGLLGGAFNAVAAPVLFDSVLEFPIALTLGYMLAELPRLKQHVERTEWLVAAAVAILLPVISLVALKVLGINLDIRTTLMVASVSIIALAAVPRLAVVAVAALFIATEVLPDEGNTIYEGRNFFGIIRVTDHAEPPVRVMVHGSTVHGVQWRGREGDAPDDPRRLIPPSYYYPGGPLSDVFRRYDDHLEGARIAVIGVGAGTMACYGRPGQSWSFYDIDPAVIELARDPDMFSFVSGCMPDARFIAGDGRLQLVRETEKIDFLVLDAFTADAVPVHLLTREAFHIYFDKLADDGLIAMHISNRFFDFRSLAGQLADEMGAVAYVRESRPDGDKGLLELMSRWVIFGRDQAALEALISDPLRPGEWEALHDGQGQQGAVPMRLWTDDYTNILGPLWRHFAG